MCYCPRKLGQILNSFNSFSYGISTVVWESPLDTVFFDEIFLEAVSVAIVACGSEDLVVGNRLPARRAPEASREDLGCHSWARSS